MTDEVASALPAYDVGGEIGRGAYGRVLSGRHRQLGRVVAIKQLDGALAHDETYRAAFLREAQVMADLSHPHVVQVFDFVDHDGLLLLVMEHLDRGSLSDAYEGGDLGAETVCGAVMAACSGVQFVHERGVLHRDLKPENLMLHRDGTLKVTDFGLARQDGDVRRTQRGDLLGTPAYMAPEQAAGGDVGRPADVYALAVTLYYLLSGAHPHGVEGGPVAVLQRRLTQPPRPLDEVAPHVPAPLVEVVMGGLHEDPTERPAGAESFGLAVGAAAWEAWGPHWISRSEVDVRAPGRVLTAADSPPPPMWRRTALAPGGEPASADATIDTRGASTPPAPMELEPVSVSDPSTRRRSAAVVVAITTLVLTVIVAVAIASTRDEGADSAATALTPRARTAAWTFATGDEVFASAAGSGSTAIIGSVDGTVYALDARDGREVWRAATGGPVRSSAAVDGGRAYVGSFDGHLYALDVTNGAEVWRAPTGFEIVSSPVVADGLVVVGGGDLRAFDAETGGPRWEFPTPEPIVSSPTVVGATVFVGGNDGQVFALDLQGKERWRYPTDGAVRSSPAVADGVVYVGSADGSLYALDAGNGVLRWKTPLGAAVNSSPALADGRVIVGTNDGDLVALAIADGVEAWRTDLRGAVDSSPLVQGDEVVVGANDGALHGLDLTTGVERWRMATGDVVLSSPVLVAERIVVGANDGKVYGVRP